MGFLKNVLKIYQPFKSIVLYIAIMVGISYVMSILVFLILTPSGQIVNDSFWDVLEGYETIIHLMTMILSLFTYFVLFKKDEKKTYRDFFEKNLHFKNYVIAFFIGIGCHVLVQGFLMTFSRLAPHSLQDGILESYNQHMSRFSFEPSLLLALFSLFFFTPIFEEILFRGLVTHQLKQKFTPKISILVQAIIFSILHVQWLHVVYTFVLGLILGYCYEKYKNILYPILLHIGFNVLNILVILQK
jgi:uncharacterized protein